jgi:branched-subunit amino acid transport protein
VTERLLLIVGMALLVYMVRLSGFALAQLRLGPSLRRELKHVPAVVLAALVAVTARGSAGGSVRLLALVVAGLVCWRTRRPWVGLIVGIVLFWLLRWVTSR